MEGNLPTLKPRGAVLSLLEQGKKVARKLRLVPGRGRETTFLPRKHGKPGLLTELREAAEAGEARALPTATSDGSAACQEPQEHRTARGKQLLGWEACCSCKLCGLAHIWLTQLDHLVQMFYFTA